MLGEFAIADTDLTARADAAPTADRIKINTKFASGLQQLRATLEMTPST